MDVFALSLIFIERVLISAVIFGVVSWLSAKLIKVVKKKLENKKAKNKSNTGDGK